MAWSSRHRLKDLGAGTLISAGMLLGTLLGFLVVCILFWAIQFLLE